MRAEPRNALWSRLALNRLARRRCGKEESRRTGFEGSDSGEARGRDVRIIRGAKLILDADLAALYEVPTKRLNEAVKRNLRRFPEDFMFRLSMDEAAALRSQIATLENGTGRRGRHSKYAPLAFTEHGVAMLSSVLNSQRAIDMNILIMRAFVRTRELIAANRDLSARVERLENKHKFTASAIEQLVVDIEHLAGEVRRMKALPAPKRRPIGFRPA